MDIRNYLHSKNFSWKEQKRTSGIWAVMDCPLCDDTNKKFAVHLENGAFRCLRENHCGQSGNFKELQLKLGDDPRPADNSFVFNKHTPTKYDKPKRKLGELTEEIYKWFANRKIKESTLTYFGVKERQNHISFNYQLNGETVSIKYRAITEKKFFSEKNTQPCLYNQDNIESSVLHITEGEVDCLSLYEYGIEGVSLPNGTKDLRWIEEQWDFLEKFEHIYLILDNDQAGQKSVEEITNRLGKWRCYNVLLPMKDLNECLVAGIESDVIFNCIKNAKEFSCEKLHAVSYYEDDVIELFNNPKKFHGTPIKYRKLNLLLKGWRSQEVTVWTGRNGSGKSTFLNEIITDLVVNNDERVCLASMELQPKRLLRWLFMQTLSYPTLSTEQIKHAMSLYNNRLWIYDSTENIPKTFLFDAFEFSARKFGVRHFFIDSLMKIQFKQKDLYEQQKQFINDLSAFSKKYNCHVHMVAHPRKSDNDYRALGKVDISGSGDIANLADNVVIVSRASEESKQKIIEKGGTPIDNTVEVRKNREHGAEGTVLFKFRTDTKNFTEM